MSTGQSVHTGYYRLGCTFCLVDSLYLHLFDSLVQVFKRKKVALLNFFCKLAVKNKLKTNL